MTKEGEDVPVTLAVHWIKARGDYQKLVDLVREFVPGKWEWEERDRACMRFKERAVRGPLGVSVNFDVNDEGERVAAVLEFPGQACEVLGPACFEFIKRFRPEDVRRIDLAFDGWRDDSGADLSPVRVYDQIEADGACIRSRLDREKVRIIKEIGGSATCYLGSRSSKRFVRCYNERGFTRIELVIQEEFAAGFAASIRGGMSWVATAIGYLRDHVDFVVPESNVSRAGLQSWWARVVEGWSRIRVAAAAADASLDQVREWMRRQVSALMATVVEADCGALDFVMELIDLGMKRRGARHSQLLIGASLASVGDPPF